MRLLPYLRHLFLPHCSNNHRAKVLHPSTMLVLVGFFLISQLIINFSASSMPAVLGFASSITPVQIIELTNKRRVEEGLLPLSLNQELNEAAKRKAGDMFAFNYWAHTSPSGRNPWSFFQEVNYKYLYAGENLARDFSDSSSVIEAWMNSPTHKDNLLNPSYREIGVAVVNGTLSGVETTLVVQLFGTPTPATAALPTISPRADLLSSRGETLAEVKNQPVLTFSPFAITKTLVVFIFGVILGALVVDAILVFRRRIVRLSGHNLAHLIFVGALLLAVILTNPGVIL